MALMLSWFSVLSVLRCSFLSPPSLTSRDTPLYPETLCSDWLSGRLQPISPGPQSSTKQSCHHAEVFIRHASEWTPLCPLILTPLREGRRGTACVGARREREGSAWTRWNTLCRAQIIHRLWNTLLHLPFILLENRGNQNCEKGKCLIVPVGRVLIWK